MFIWMKNQTAYNQKMSDEKAAALLKFDAEKAQEAQQMFNLSQFDDATIATNLTLRELKKIQTVGLVLSDADSATFQNLVSSMQSIYNGA